MANEGGEGPKRPDRTNVFSIAPDKEEKKAIEQISREHAEITEYLQVFGYPEKPLDVEKIREIKLDIKSAKILDTLRADHAVHEFPLNEKIEQPDIVIGESKHEDWLQNPAKFWEAASRYLKDLDELASVVLDEDTAKKDIHTRFPIMEISEDAQRLVDATAPYIEVSEKSFSEEVASMREWVSRISTVEIVLVLRAYLAGKEVKSPSYLVTLLEEYKERRKLVEK